MSKFLKSLAIFSTIALTFMLAGPSASLAATTPSLGAAAYYSILSSSYTNTTAGTTVNGAIGFTTGPAVRPVGTQPYYGSGTPYSTAGTDQGAALSLLAAEPCTYTFPDSDIDLATDTTHGTIGLYAPGVYCTASGRSASIGTSGITLSGAGTYIFRIDGAFTTVNNSNVVLSGASECDVFWTATAATTLGTDTTFQGTVIDAAGITVGANTNWTGRALAFGGTVTTDTATITAPPTCSAAPAPSTTPREGTINVVKNVINDNRGTMSISGFPLFVNETPVVSGVTNTFRAPAGIYTVTETMNSNYTQSFSGDCDANGDINLIPGDNKFCIITNNDIGSPIVTPPVPPLINVVKVPSPLSLPNGPGVVNYTYTLYNIGTVPVTNITMVGDTCAPLIHNSGDLNSNSILEVNETWVYTCSTILNESHTNTVVATGWANGLTATDIASAHVVVGQPIVPPIINITKTPNPFALLAGGGMVTYTKVVTNPGTEPLSNIQITDDKCSPLIFVSGDFDGDSMLDPNESWIYTCRTNVTQTITNTAWVSGQANGLTARDFAIATVVVAAAVPILPSAGATPDLGNYLALAVLAGLLLLTAASYYLVTKNNKV